MTEEELRKKIDPRAVELAERLMEAGRPGDALSASEFQEVAEFLRNAYDRPSLEEVVAMACEKHGLHLVKVRQPTLTEATILFSSDPRRSYWTLTVEVDNAGDLSAQTVCALDNWIRDRGEQES